MDRSLLTTLFILIILTLASAQFSWVGGSGMPWVPLAIMGLAAAKFIMVAFRFMELRKAHAFWRTGVVVVAVLLAAIVGALVP